MRRFMIRGSAAGDSERGQMLPLVALSAAVLIAMVGLGIDLGFAYVTKARLSKACDAAALAGMENINQGTITAAQIAYAQFYANYANGALKTSLDTGTVTPTFTFSPNSSSATQMTVSAKTTIQTFFIKVLSSLGDNPWKTEVVGDSSIVSRGRLDFTLVLDKSTSLAPASPGNPNGNGGQLEMYPAVTNFLSFFSDVLDKGALVTFANLATINTAMSSPFTTNISNAVKTIYVNGTGFGGGTDSPAGMTNGLAIENAILQPSTSNLVKAVIFFTDGHANEIQAKMTCTPPASLVNTNLIFGGHDPFTQDANCITYFDPGTGTNLGTGGGGICGTFCQTAGDSTTFASIHGTGGVLPLTADNVRQESEDRCLAYADQMRANGTVVCTIGLGIGQTGPDVNFLQIVANDPASSGYSPTPYDGIYSPATNSTDMAIAFQRVAENLLLRLVH